MEASANHKMKGGDPAHEETERGGTGVPHFYSDPIQAELLNLQSETELLFAQLQALSRSQPATVG
ncbi:MAG: hypothetical protein ACUVSQ_10270 [Pseudanabaenaceae cyanobacterium]